MLLILHAIYVTRNTSNVYFFMVLLLCHEIYSETLEPEVHILSLTIMVPDRPELVLPIPFIPNAKGFAFSLKDGSQYRLTFSFTVSNNIVSGLRYTNTVWKAGVRGIYKPSFSLLPYLDECYTDHTKLLKIVLGLFLYTTYYIMELF